MLGHLDHRLHEGVECLVRRVIAPLTRGCLLTGLDFPRQEKRVPCYGCVIRLKIEGVVLVLDSLVGGNSPRSPMFLFAAPSHWTTMECRMCAMPGKNIVPVSGLTKTIL